MRDVVVVGAGAMGVLLAVRMSRSGTRRVFLLARPERARLLREHGVRLERLPGLGDGGEDGDDGDEGEDGDHGRRRDDGPLEAGESLSIVTDPQGLPSGALVFFAVRAYQTKEAARMVKDAGVDPAGVVTLQNGLGNAEALAQVFSAGRVVAGATSHGVLYGPPARFVHTGWGKTALGPWSQEGGDLADEAVRALEEGGIPVTRVDDPRPVLWRKVAVNAAINPATAIHRVENGKLLDGGERERDLREAAREVARVAQAEGIDISEDEAQQQAVEVARMTSRNRSSMLQALEAGRPLELDAITGEVVARARPHRIPVPVNEAHLKRLAARVASTEDGAG